MLTVEVHQGLMMSTKDRLDLETQLFETHLSVICHKGDISTSATTTNGGEFRTN